MACIYITACDNEGIKPISYDKFIERGIKDMETIKKKRLNRTKNNKQHGL